METRAGHSFRILVAFISASRVRSLRGAYHRGVTVTGGYDALVKRTEA
jgi:hypothetical protein